MVATLRRICPAIVLMLLGMLGILASCTKESSPDPLLPPVQTVNELVETTGWFPTIIADSTTFTEARFDSSSAVGDGLQCADYVGHQVLEVPRLNTLAASTTVHYPGSVLQYAYLDGQTPAVVAGDRAGAPLTLIGADGTELPGEVTALDGDLVEAWRQQNLTSLPAAEGDWQLSLHLIRDPAQIALGAGVHPPALPTQVSADLEARDLNRGRVLVRLQRIHHTMTCPYPGRAGRAFADHVVGGDLEGQMSEGNPPVWVGSVQYGQVLLILLEADASFAEMAEAAGNSVAAAVADGDPDPSLLALDDLEGLDVAAHGVAVDAPAAVQALLAGVGELADMLAQPVSDPAALPAMSADLKALRNGGPLTLGLTGEYEFTACELYEPVFAEVLWGLDAADARTERRNTDLQTDGDAVFYYNGGVRVFNYAHVTSVPDLKGEGNPTVPGVFGRRPVLFPHFLGDRPVIELYELDLPDGHIFAELLFDGSPFVATPYTFFMVLGSPDRVHLTVEAEPQNIVYSRTNRLNYVVHGADMGTRGSLQIGWGEIQNIDEGYLNFIHSPYTLAVPGTPPEGWHVFAFRFGTSGMSIFEDGVEIGQIDWDFSLLQFSGATLSARRQGYAGPSHAVLWLAEAVAYRGEGSDEMVADETARLQEKFGL